MKLIDILTSGLEYSSTWGIYAELIDGKFTSDSEARFGQRHFENGGLNDGFELFANNEYSTDQMDQYLGRTDGRDEDTITKWDILEAAEFLIDETNSAR